jgi:hypothetical protein
MTATDTRAALDAAILKYGGDAAESYEFHARPPGDRDLNAAITAHVAAEVARALACAPDVEQWIGGIVSRALRGCSDNGARADLMREADALRAAIAADKSRAVEASTRYTRPAVSAESAAQLVARFEESTGHEMRRRIDGDRKALIDALTGGEDAPARPTPAEARRLVEVFRASVAAHAQAVALDPDYATDAGEPAARAALLRALGVEA